MKRKRHLFIGLISIFLMVCPGKAGPNSIDAYWILPDTSNIGTPFEIQSKKYLAKKVSLNELIVSSQLISQDNINSKYSFNIKPIPSPEKEFLGLILKHDDFLIMSSSHGGSHEILDSISFYIDSSIATQIGKTLKIDLKKRQHPGHQLLTRFLWENDKNNTVAILEIHNVGNGTVIFQDGGMSRAKRNNQFSFIGFKENKPLLDIGSPSHFGGISTLVTLKKGEIFKKSIDISKWFDVSEKGFYEIIGTYYLAFYESKNDHRIIWTDYVTSKFSFKRN